MTALRGLRDDQTALDVAGVGEVMLLLHPPAGERLADATTAAIDVAGAELNVCAAVTRFGWDAALCTRVGADPPGERVLRTLTALGISPQLVTTSHQHPTGLLLRELQADGARRVCYYRTGSAASHLNEADARALLQARPRAAVVSGLTAALGDEPEKCVRGVIEGAAPAQVCLVVDANIRPTLGRLRQVRDLLLSYLPLIDLFVLGADEAAHLFGTQDPGVVLTRLIDSGVGEAVLTAGHRGVFLMDQAELRHVPAQTVRVVDPVGAGDAFTGAYLAARLRRLSPTRSACIASQVAARVVEAPGDLAGLPTAEQATRLLGS